MYFLISHYKSSKRSYSIVMYSESAQHGRYKPMKAVITEAVNRRVKQICSTLSLGFILVGLLFVLGKLFVYSGVFLNLLHHVSFYVNYVADSVLEHSLH